MSDKKQDDKTHLPVCCDTILHSSAAALASSVSSPPTTAGKSRQKGYHYLNSPVLLDHSVRSTFSLFVPLEDRMICSI